MKAKLLILGAGPGGYVSAVRAGRLSLEPVLVEKHKIGGVCLNYGCIPTKVLLSKTEIFDLVKKGKRYGLSVDGLNLDFSKLSAHKQRIISGLVKGIENLLQQSGVKIIPEEGRFIDEKKLELASGEIMEYDNAIIATGSRNRNLTNVIVDDKNILDSTSALALTEIPKSILIIGAGAIGLEMGLIFQRLGAEVTIVEIMAEILPGMDPELSQMLRTVLVRNDLNFHLNSSVREINSTPSGNFEVKISNLESPVLVEKILLSAGRIPNVEAVQKLELSRNPGAYIQIDENFSTSIPQVKAIGDVTGPPLLAHKASHQGIMAVEIIAGRKDLSHFPPIPAAVFTEPEFACVGLTYQQAKEKNLEPEENIFPLAAVSRARTLDAPEGAFKIVSDRKGKILGVHILAPHAGELIAQASLAMHKELKVKDLANTICVHPTLSEGLMESALLADHRPLHI